MLHDRRSAPRVPAVCLLFLSSAAGCATFGEQGQSLVPTRHETRTGPFAVYSNFPIPPDAPIIRALHSLETDVESTLGVRVAAEKPSVEVYILSDRQAFDHFLKFHYPELPPRRAFFLAKDGRRVVYTFLGERLNEDLRHEATHALLHVAVGDIPLWLDEGLAEYFEGTDPQRGVNREHLSRLPQDVALGWKPDLAKLESLKSVREMSTRDYRESWAWVHYLLNGSNPGKAALLSYLADLHATPDARPLSERLSAGERDLGAPMLAHVKQVGAQPVAAVASQEPTVRLQNPQAEPPRVVVAPRRGFFGRLGAFFGL